MTAQFPLLDYIEARTARDLGITSAADHADDVIPGWTDIAFQWIKTYALAHSEFISEDVTEAAEAQRLIDMFKGNPKLNGDVK